MKKTSQQQPPQQQQIKAVEHLVHTVSSSPTASASAAPAIKISQTVAILVDGNNIERSLQEITGREGAMLNFDSIIPRLLNDRGLNRLVYFREGVRISSKLAERLHNHYYGSVVACHKSADIPLSIMATQLASKVDTIIIMSGDSDYVELVRHLKSEGVRVEIAAVTHATAGILLEECHHFHQLTDDDWFTHAPSAGKRSRHSHYRGKTS